MRVVIDISEHDKEWIGNAYGIPQEINTKIAEAIINAEPCHPEPHWIPVTERLPKEEDSIFARYYGTDRWRKSMFRKKSREVIVTSVFEDGELHTEVAHTTDGEWHVGVNVVPRTVIAWMPLPEPYKGVTDGRD